MNNAATSVTASGFKSLAWVSGLLASVAAAVVATVMALVFTASLVVIAVMASALVAFALLASRARRALRRASSAADPQIIEARNVGGHSWVAYGWDRGN